MKINCINILAFFFASITIIATAPPALADRAQQWDENTRAVYDLLLAQMQHANTDYAGAADTLVKYAKTQKNNKLYHKALQALIQTKRYQEAIALLNVWRKNSKADLTALEVFTLTLNDKTDAAIKVIDKALGSTNDAGIRRRLTGFNRMLLGIWYNSNVLAVYKALHQAYPNDQSIGISYSRILRWHGYTDKAVEIIDHYLFEKGKDLNLVQEKSDIYRYALDLKRARQVWQNLLRDYPNNPVYQLAQAQFLYDCYDFTSAYQALLTITTDDKTLRASISRLKILALIQQGKDEQALASSAWQKLKASAKDQLYYRIGDMLLNKKQFALAEKALNHIANDSDFYLAAQIKLGSVMYNSSSAAGDAWFEQLKNNPKLTLNEWLKSKAEVLDSLGDTLGAYQVLTELLHKNPENQSIRYARSLLASQMGNNKQAIVDLKILHASNPDDSQYQNALGYTLLTQSQSIDEGAALIEKSLLEDPANAATVDSMGWAKYQQKKYHAALPYLRYAYSQIRDAEVIAHYILALFKADNMHLAQQLYHTEIRYQPNVKKIHDHLENSGIPDLMEKLKGES